MTKQKLSEDEINKKIVSLKFEKFYNSYVIPILEETDQQNIVGGKLPPSINIQRENILVAALKLYFGKENVETIKKKEKIFDVILFGQKYSIKHADCTEKTLPSITCNWGLADNKKFIENYNPDYPTILIPFKYGKTGKFFYIIPSKVQKEVFEKITKNKFFEKGDRGTEFTSEVVKLLMNHPETESFDVSWFARDKDNPDSGIDYYVKRLQRIINEKNYNLSTPNLDNNLVETIKIQNRIGRKKCDFKVDLNGKIFYNPSSAKTTYQEVLHSIIDTIGHDELLKNFPNFLASTKDKLSIKRQKDQYEYRGVCYSTHLSNAQKVKNINNIFKKYPYTLSGQATTQEL